MKTNLIERNPEEIAEFLLTTPGLAKESIGIYLGKNDPCSKKVLKAFCEKLDFRN